MLKALSKKEKEKLDSVADMRHAPKKQVLYFPTESSSNIYMLKAGKVKISRISPDGKEIILAILGPGEVFGELGITGKQEREEIAEVTDDAIICVVGLEDLQRMMKDNPKFNTEILKLIGFRLKRIQSRLESLIFKTAEQRIRSLIKELAEEHGRIIAGDENQREVRLGLTHDEMAKLTATSRQTVTTQLNELEKNNLIKYDRKRVYVKDLRLL
ncbi:Crp/Fnr family transcriptional regulator [Pontibacter diazotrophicus]|nr:Crp/Fnr family transcriptional regulator [Pontibacter diazotrophicus]